MTVLPGRTGLPPEVRASLEADGFTIVDGPTTLPQLVRRLSDSHIVHFVGHGAYRAGEPDQPPESALFLEDEDGAWDPATATRLVERFAAAEAAPALVYLSACETGRAADAQGHPFLGLAPRLVDAGAAAVVAMQAPVPVDTARTLTFDFYRELLEHGVVDVALNAARAVVFEPDRLEWTIPVLFSRLREGRLLVARELAQQVIADDVAIAPEAEHGVVANRVSVVPVARARPVPVLRLPRDFPDLVGREAEVGRGAGDPRCPRPGGGPRRAGDRQDRAAPSRREPGTGGGPGGRGPRRAGRRAGPRPPAVPVRLRCSRLRPRSVPRTRSWSASSRTARPSSSWTMRTWTGTRSGS